MSAAISSAKAGNPAGTCDYIDEKSISAEVNKINKFLQEICGRQAAGNRNKRMYTMSPAARNYMDKNSLAYNKSHGEDSRTKQIWQTVDDWNTAISSLKAHRDRLKGLLGRYDSHPEGAGAAAWQCNQTPSADLKMG
ncbi:MAG: hypothetical protein LBQ51_08905 [Desulfovibrio sp.]|jgi:hypothetical protein|nr:hypothetical protein [Desulfovibrio sp.]